MSTVVNSNGKGLVITTVVSDKPALRPSTVFKLPAHEAQNASYITATLVAVAGAAVTKKAIQVQNSGQLPTASSWELRWYAYQGTAPSTPSYNHAPLTLVNGSFSYSIDNPLPNATVVMNLRGYESNLNFFDYLPVQIATPAIAPTPVTPASLSMTTSDVKPA